MVYVRENVVTARHGSAKCEAASEPIDFVEEVVLVFFEADNRAS
jgi:hypothetical protein